MNKPGTPYHPLRVAVIGSGPSGFYATEALFKRDDLTVYVDMYDRLPTPYGLVRGGVAPDHAKIKSVTKVYDRIAENEHFRFFGNVEFGSDVTKADLHKHYHAIIYAVGAQTDRSLGIDGEDLPGSHAATEFVAWYNAHPDYRHFKFDLTQEAAVVVGVGNVAMDVARILARTEDELHETDIADYALEALANSNIKRIYVLGRRGAAQAAFTNPEIKELGEMEGADVIVEAREVDIDPLSQAYLDTVDEDKEVKVAVKNVDYLKQYSQTPPSGKPKQIIFKFLASPVEIIGTDRVEAVKIVRNELYLNERGTLRPRATEEYETIPAGLIFRSVGYRGVALPDVPFHEAWGTIPHEDGRVMTQLEGGEQVTGDYVVGWIKRGPSGIIGTNKPDSVATVESLIADLEADKLLDPSNPDGSIEDILIERGVRYVTYADWLIIDQLEAERGEAQGRPRVKFSRVDEMLDALDVRKAERVADTAGD